MRERSHPFGFLCCKEPAGRQALGTESLAGLQGIFMAAGFPAKYGASFPGLHFL